MGYPSSPQNGLPSSLRLHFVLNFRTKELEDYYFLSSTWQSHVSPCPEDVLKPHHLLLSQTHLYYELTQTSLVTLFLPS